MSRPQNHRRDFFGAYVSEDTDENQIVEKGNKKKLLE